MKQYKISNMVEFEQHVWDCSEVIFRFKDETAQALFGDGVYTILRSGLYHRSVWCGDICEADDSVGFDNCYDFLRREVEEGLKRGNQDIYFNCRF